ncbi:hypothetical protein [Candidatus Rhodoluna planktonica]|uniref:Big-1 domain-containing protein n=1 Tax=Candidatus Rhodoluna planktonica TaxID=535712 RepID=A0A1D9E0J3_9MICO|nr:hypothetical protein [Candidatus Rhodoluna planktonica]AOY56540.1 hypothetical protein A4Z71_06240 [Candidatus Rhodoluna planktonica]
MSKNLTRKGVAFGALVALGSSVITGAPAFAVDNVALTPNTGTSYLTTLAGAFVLKAEFGGAVATSQLGDLRFKIDQTGDKVVSAAIGSDLTGGGASYTFATANSSTANASFVTDKLPARSTPAVDGEQIAAYTETAAVKLTVSGTATVSANVTAWLDLDNDGVIDTTEYSSPTRTVTFHKVADLTAVTTLTAPVAGAASLAASSVITPELNSAMLANNAVTVDFAGGNAQDGNASFADAKWSATGTTTVAGGTTYTAQLKVDGTAVGNVASQSVAAVTVSSITAAVTDTTDTEVIAPANQAATLKQDKVRTGVKSAEVVLTLKKSDGKAVAAGIPAVVTVASTAITTPATALVKINGTAAAAVGQTVNLNVVTDANGQVKLAVTNQLGTAGDKLTFTATSEGVALDTNTGNLATGAQGLELLWANAAYTIVRADDFADAGQRSIASGAAASLSFYVRDNYGAPISGAARIYATTPAGDATVDTHIATITNGTGTITVTDKSDDATSPVVVTAEVQTQNATTLNWSQLDVTNGSEQIVTNLTVTASADTIDTDPSATYSGSITDQALTTYNAVVGGTAPTHSNAVAITASANVGGKVTVSAPGLMIKVGGSYFKDSAVVLGAASNGDVAFSVFSTSTGEKTVTVTAGTTVKTTKVTFANASTSGASWSWETTPSSIGAGKTLVVVAKLVDKFGNAVDADASKVSVVYDGPGLLIGSLPATTEADGTLTFRYLLGANELGSASIKLTYAGANGTLAEASNNDDVVATKTIKIGSLPVAAAVAGVTKAVNVTVRNAAGQGVVITVNGKVVIARRAAADVQPFSAKTTAGKKTVVVKVAGKTVATRTVTVK